MVILGSHRSPLFRFSRFLVGLAACLVLPSQAVEVVAQLDRESVAAGEGALLSLEISAELAVRPKIPAVENLIVRPHGQSKQIQIVNGTTTMTVSFTYLVGAQVPADYLIPPIEVVVDGKPFSSLPLKLKVVDAGAAQPSAGIPPVPQGQQVPVPVEETGEDRFGFLTVELADSVRKHAYVGEIAPVRIRAWLPAGAQANLRSGIQPEGGGFTLHNVSSQSQQTEEIRDGKRYTVVTWFGGISATKAGKLPASLSVDATVAVRDTSAPRQKRRRTGGPFDDPFFDRAFDRMSTPMIQKEVTLKSDDQEIEVRPLPTKDRPGGFTGAVGDFKFDNVEVSRDWKTGEPQQIMTRLSGSGNFALMKAPVLTPVDAWKTYQGKDEFNAADEAAFSGNKTFQFSAVPRKGGKQNAALEFSYFDPAAEVYKTITWPINDIQVSGNDLPDDKPAAVLEAKEPQKKKVEMAGLHEKISPRRSLLPLGSRKAFTEILVISSLLFSLGIILGCLRIRREDPKRRSREKLELAIREAVKAVAGEKNAQGFFSAARLAIQQQLGVLWNQPPLAITTAEVASRIARDSPVTRFFQEADLYEYNRRDSGEILPHWRELFAEALASITHSPR
jgi:BatD DUF11 like domain